MQVVSLTRLFRTQTDPKIKGLGRIRHVQISIPLLPDHLQHFARGCITRQSDLAAPLLTVVLVELVCLALAFVSNRKWGKLAGCRWFGRELDV